MLTGKTAIVTGGGRGIGAAISKKLAGLGAGVAIVYAGNELAAAGTAAECGPNARIYRCDAADFLAVKAAVAQIRQDFGGVDILVNNAGINRDGLLAMMKDSDFDDVIAANLKGAFNFLRHCAPLFIRAHGGRIVNISSVAGLMGNAGQVNYAASKAGIIGLTKSAARELAGKNITCNAIAPGFIRTDMTKDFDESNPLVASIPLRRMGSPEDVANLAAFLVSEEAGYITGEVIRVDGGIAM